MRQQFDLGSFIKNRYIDTGFLSSNYRHEEVCVLFFYILMDCIGLGFNITVSKVLINSELVLLPYTMLL